MTDEQTAKEMTYWQQLRCSLDRWFFINVSRRLPRLVWIGDEIDVRVTFSEDPINQADPLRGLFSGGLFEIEKQFHHMGVKFDTGQGFGGRDWEWDWALGGPISVTFKGRVREPEKRKARRKPKLVFCSPTREWPA